METDSVQHFIFEHHAIRGELVSLDQTFQTICQQRDYPTSVQQFLGETLLVNVLLTSGLKFEGQNTIQMKHDGPLQMLVSKCNHHLQVRGLAVWDESATQQEISQSFRHGELVITIQPDRKADFHQSIVRIKDQTTAQAMEHFFLQSEQLPTRLYLAVNSDRAVGLMIQKVAQERRDEEKEKAIWDEVVMLTDTITKNELLTLDNQSLLHRLYHEHDLRLFSPKPVEFRCGCSLTKMEGVVLNMGREEAKKLLTQYKMIEVTCEYCNNAYSFTESEVNAILANH
jgi:molecular chaperone Hsp33